MTLAEVNSSSDHEPSQKQSADGTMLYIPGGTFRMGSDRHYPEEAPAHRVTVDGFWMDRVPVTNRQFRQFVEATFDLGKISLGNYLMTRVQPRELIALGAALERGLIVEVLPARPFVVPVRLYLGAANRGRQNSSGNLLHAQMERMVGKEVARPDRILTIGTSRNLLDKPAGNLRGHD